LQLEEILESGPGPEFEAQAAEECRRLLDKLDDDRLAAVARWRMEGYTTSEIAQRLACSPRTVERKLQLIQALWAEEVAA
jgi:DNA-directed RNA polymerase specialized sigma24 family protein